MIIIINSCVEAEKGSREIEKSWSSFSTSCTKTVALDRRRTTSNVKILNNHQNKVKS